MSDNINDDPLNNPIIPQSENFSDEIISSIETDTKIPKHETENMEVHHHPKVEKKNFKEYLLEGLMIFIAVTMGFFAETIREHIVERERAEEYASTMLSDLVADTKDLKEYIKYTNYAISNTDTLMLLLSRDSVQQISTGKLYWYGLWGGAHDAFVPHDATISQMKSSGTLRYFTNEALNHDVAEYDQLCRKWEKNAQADLVIYTEVRKARAKIFEFKYNDAANNIYQANKISFSQARIDSFIQNNPPLLSHDKAIINEYIEMIRSRFLKQQVGNADTLLLHSIKLISELKTKYQLTHE